MKQNKNTLTRRNLLKRAAGASAGLIAAPMLNLGRFRIFADSTKEYSARAVDLLKQFTVVDMLSVLTLDFAKQGTHRRRDCDAR